MRRPLLLALVGFSVNLFVYLPKSSSDSPAKNSEFVYARIRYHMTSGAWMVREVPWHHDYPYADETFPTVLGEVTNIKTSSTSYKIVDIDSPELFDYPFAYLCEPGYLELNAKDVVNLRRYLDRGGFLFVDDFRTADFSRQAGGGPEDDIANFRVQMKKVYPDRDFVRLDLSDPIFNTFYKINSLNMEPPYIFPGQHPVEFLGLRDTHENLLMVLDNNNDISEFWEWLDEGQRSMRDAATAFHFGINYVMYAMTR
ncbi:MAG TPA: DUF4159 domain-containing protein [Acidobacteriota bacterium]|nr:DUF4159 domain-containing protein [Acidobacteriota bacterium]